MIRLAHDQQRQVVPDRNAEPIDELFGRNAELQALVAFGVGPLFEQVTRNAGNAGRCGGGAQGQRQVRIAVVVDGDDALTAVGHHPGQRAGDGRLPGTAFSCHRDLHDQASPREVSPVSACRARMASRATWWRATPFGCTYGVRQHGAILRAMPYNAWFECINGCPGEFDLREVIYRCPTCGDLLEVQHDVEALRSRSAAAWMQLFKDRTQGNVYPYGSGVWSKKEWVVPFLDNENIVSMFEGNSNLLWANRYGKQ